MVTMGRGPVIEAEGCLPRKGELLAALPNFTRQSPNRLGVSEADFGDGAAVHNCLLGARSIQRDLPRGT